MPRLVRLCHAFADPCHHVHVIVPRASEVAAACQKLAEHGARFAYLHGSQASGQARADSDIDLAAYFDPPVPAAFEVDVPAGIDLLILNTAPLEIRGRIALHGQLVLEVDPVARVRWESMTRKIYLDEKPRIDRSHADFLAAVARGG